MTDKQTRELARTINATELTLRRYFYHNIFKGGEDESVPALTPPQVEMIIEIHAHASITVKELARVLCVKAPSASTRVERLVEMGMLTREENPADRREVLVRIAPERLELMAKLEQRKFRASVDLIEKLGTEHAHMWQEVCERINVVLDKTGCGEGDGG